MQDSMRDAAARRCDGPSVRRVLTAGVAIGALLGANFAYAEGLTFVPPTGGLKVHPLMLRAHPGLNGRLAMYPHVQHTAAQRAAIDAKLDAIQHGATAAGTRVITVPYWTTTLVSPLDGKKYAYDMVGTSPYATTPQTWTVTAQPVIVKVNVTTKTGTVTFDPTAPSLCGDTASVETRFLKSPLFNNAAFVSNGVSMGNLQLPDAFMRANFWSVAKNTNYGVRLHLLTPIVITETISGTVASNITCSPTNPKTTQFGSIDYATWQNDVVNIATTYGVPNQVVLILTYNVAEAAPHGGGYYLGWHDAFATSAGVQTYGVGSYFDPPVFTGIDDVSTWSHELSEWLDDPFAQEVVPHGNAYNLTPAWGNVGQVLDACQNNLEVGDPLSGTLMAMPNPAGDTNFTYHQQDLTFVDWFYRTPTDKAATASNATGGMYSFLGSFNGKEVPACTSSNDTTIGNSQGATPRATRRVQQ